MIKIKKPGNLLGEIIVSIKVIVVALLTVGVLCSIAGYGIIALRQQEQKTPFSDAILITFSICFTGFVVCSLIIALYRKMKLGWYPYLFGTNQYFFVTSDLRDISHLKLKDSRWQIVSATRDKVHIKYFRRPEIFNEPRAAATENALFRCYAMQIQIFPLQNQSAAIVHFYLDDPRIGAAYLRVSESMLKRYKEIMKELLNPTNFFNEKWQKIDDQWNVIESTPLAGAPQIEHEE